MTAIFPLDEHSVDSTAFVELLTAPGDDFLDNGSQLVEWSVITQSSLALFPDDSPVFPAYSFASGTSYASIFSELELNSRPSNDMKIANEPANILVGDIGDSLAESSNLAIGTNNSLILRYSLSSL